jgi:LysR family transcriptional regulator, nod-box dependent transcriptional activator
MKPVNLRRHNLNALPVLRSILRHGNLTRAAAALGLTQPALSNVLRQLRVDFDDALIVRNGKAMQLTPKAAALLGPLEASLSSIEALLSQDSFDPLTATNRFRIATTDHVMATLCPPLMTLVTKDSPNVSVNVSLAQPASVQALMVGDIDMVITPQILLSAGIGERSALDSATTEFLMRERLVCLAHRDDAAFAAGLSVDDYLRRPHAGYNFGGQHLASMEQVQLMRLAHEQNDVMLVSSYAALPAMVAHSRCLALIPESMAKSAAALLPLQYAPPPLPLAPMEWVMVWHSRNDNDPSLKWLRTALKSCVAEVGETLAKLAEPAE